MNANDINENITFKNTGSLFKAFDKYNKLKEFEAIPNLIESKELKNEMDSIKDYCSYYQHEKRNGDKKHILYK